MARSIHEIIDQNMYDQGMTIGTMAASFYNTNQSLTETIRSLDPDYNEINPDHLGDPSFMRGVAEAIIETRKLQGARG